MSIYQQIKDNKLIAILRGANPSDVVRIATALYEGGIRLLEITMNSAAPLQVIEEVAHELGDDMVIGAGTVLNAVMAADAVSAGARFILSPIVEESIITATKKLNVVSIPGAYTATEIFTAHRAGADMVKVFPANSPAYIKALRAPLPHIPLLPTGGITTANIRDYLNAGAIGFGIGSTLVDTGQPVTELYLKTLKENARQFVAAIQ